MDLTRLDEETEFERLALDTGTPLVEPLYGWVDLRTDPRGSVGSVIGPAVEGAEAVDRFAATLRPLLFGAAWKVLDRVVECALPPLSNGGHYTNSSKAARARDLNVPVWAPFVKKDQEWQGALQDDLLFQVGQLERYSGVAPTLGDVGMNRLCEVHVNLRGVGPGCVELDVPALQQPMQHQVQYRRFDVVAYLPAPQEGRPLIGRLETAPVNVVQFDPDHPPAWLSRTSQRHTLLG